MTVMQPLLGIVESALNRYLALDPEVSGQLAELEDACIALRLEAPDVEVYCEPRARSLHLLAGCERSPDCSIQGSALSLIKLLRSDEPTALLHSGEVKIHGDSRIAQRFSDILKQMEIDWEELMSKLVGDFAAHRIGVQTRQAQAWVKETLRALQWDTKEYLQEESGLLPTRIEVNHLFEQTEFLRADVDRLEARIKRLERKTSREQNSTP